MPKLNELRQKRAAACAEFSALADKEALNDNEKRAYETKKAEIVAIDDQIKREQERLELVGETTQPVRDQEEEGARTIRDLSGRRVPVTPQTDPYANDNAAREYCRKRGLMEGSAASLCMGGMIQCLVGGNSNLQLARQIAAAEYGESHPVTRALVTSTGSAGGFIVPPDYMAEIIELLRPKAVVRASGPRMVPMPRGTMRLPGQSSAATGGYGAEGSRITSSQQGLNSITATFKKLTALVPVSNDMMRYADPAVDAFVRDDLVKVVGLTEDKNFILGDGTQDTPKGYLFFANDWVQAGGGTIGVWSTSANSTLAVNGSDPANSTGGNFVTSNAAYTLATVASELGGAINRLDQANVPDAKRVWFMNPRSKNYLYNVQNSLGVYVYRDEMNDGKLLGYPFRVTTQIGTNYWDASGTNKDLSFVFLAEMEETMILDSMQLELAVSREGSYVDASGATISAFQNDQTLIRAIAEHDFQLRHLASVAVIQAVRWAPAIS